MFLEISQNSQEKKESLTQVFYCEFCEISKNTYFYRTPLVTASGCCALETLICWNNIFCADYTFSVYGTVVECITLINHTAGNILS